ncbi:MAG: hypothetical protein WCI72_01195 [archaeon]
MVDSNQAALVNIPAPDGVPIEEMLFGKWHVKDRKTFKDSIRSRVLDDGHVLASTIFYHDREKVFFSADFACNIPEAHENRFKALYSDAKEYFRSKGISVDSLVKPDEPNHKVSSYLASIHTFGSLVRNITSEEELKLVIRSMGSAIDDYFEETHGMPRQELVDYGMLGKISNGSKIWEPKEGLYVIMEAPLSVNSPWHLQMQFNCDEKHDTSKLVKYQQAITSYLEQRFEFFNNHVINNSDPRIDFRIDLSELLRKKLKANDELAFLVE